ncbi:MAG: FAD-dependent oxidoreductase [Chloroflexi bacterium]|nr:FAD-dependent oxidoreductase [Chloroflexota bacterium]
MTRIVILGAGPTGLGAAYRLQELGYQDWDLYEQHDYIGGLAASFRDDRGFTHDVGGHVMFSHYPYYDALVEKLMGDNYTEIMRESWIWMRDRFIPYPFQNNIKYLPREEVLECVLGLIEAQRHPRPSETFAEWIEATFGQGIARHFMLPYNAKVWAHPLDRMSKHWIAERVSVVDSERVLRNVILDRDDVSWGPNSRFKYPLHGGTGGLFNAFLPYVEPRLHLQKAARQVDFDARVVEFDDGTCTRYDVLISSLPIDQLVTWSKGAPPEIREAAARLDHSSSYIVGVGVAAPCPSTRCWLYFPEQDCPFYRVTYLSNYSPFIAPDEHHYLLLTETSYSPWKPEPGQEIVERVVDGLVTTGLLEEADRARIASTHLIDVPYSYPVPTLERDDALAIIQPFLLRHDVYSRGRFGAWLYEIGNMDHSTMQGVEAVNSILLGDKETTWKPSEPSSRTPVLRAA